MREAASGATHILDGAVVYDTLGEAIADLHYVLATTARERGQMKRVFAPDEAMRNRILVQNPEALYGFGKPA